MPPVARADPPDVHAVITGALGADQRDDAQLQAHSLLLDPERRSEDAEPEAHKARALEKLRAFSIDQVVDQVAMPLAFQAMVRSPVTLPTSASAVTTLKSLDVVPTPVDR